MAATVWLSWWPFGRYHRTPVIPAPVSRRQMTRAGGIHCADQWLADITRLTSTASGSNGVVDHNSSGTKPQLLLLIVPLPDIVHQINYRLALELDRRGTAQSMLHLTSAGLPYALAPDAMRGGAMPRAEGAPAHS